MATKRPRYKVGVTVFYPSAGVGVILAVEDIYLSGQVESCFVIRIQDTQMTVKVPKSNLEKSGTRPLLDGKKLKELFKILSAKGKRRVTGGNWAERCKDIERRINSGSCLELGEVMRDLTRWKKHSGLSSEESMLLDTANSYLSREVAAVQRIVPDSATL